jgi:PIN domain nuclease of toxin-antitoxin system
MDVTNWVARSKVPPFVHFIPADAGFGIKSVQLPLPLHHDPGDRIIIATGPALGFPLLTPDKKIAGYPHIRTIW